MRRGELKMSENLKRGEMEEGGKMGKEVRQEKRETGRRQKMRKGVNLVREVRQSQMGRGKMGEEDKWVKEDGKEVR